MDADKWKEIKEVFSRAVELEGDARSAFVSSLQDEALQREVKKLLVADEAAEMFFEDVSIVANISPVEYTGKYIGNYKILRELGRGGMGTVFLAERADLKQKVALKVIRHGIDSDLILRRFRREQEILAALEHPNIARLLDVGVSAENVPFLVMEYIEGEDLLEFCGKNNFSVSEKLVLFRKVCAAVSYAHSRLVVHRDLKPSNILVNEKGEPKLLDFGISKLISETGSGEDKGTVTSFGMLTPNYASPEQFRGETVSTSTDVYSLGVILYELLTGVLPYEVVDKRFDEVARVVCETQPKRPSSAVENVSTVKNSTRENDNRKTSGDDEPRKSEYKPAKTDSRRLKGDIDNIVLKSLRKEPERRYLSVEQLSEDLQRHLAGLPVTARPATLFYRTEKFIKRNRAVVFSGVSIFLILIIAVAGISWQFVRAERQRVLAEKRFGEVRQMANNVVFKYYDEADKLSGSTKMRELMVTDALNYLDELARDSAGDASLQKELGQAYIRIGRVQGRVYNTNLGNTNGAVESYRKGIELLEPLAGASEDVKFQWDLVNAEGELSSILRRQGNFAEADSLLKKTIALGEKFLAASPDDPTLLARSAYSYYFLGDTLPVGTGENENITAYQNCITAAEKALARDPNHLRANNILAAALQRIGNQTLLLARDAAELGDEKTAQKLREEAAPYYYKSIEICEKLIKLQPDDILYQSLLSTAKVNESEYLLETAQYEAALRVERRGLDEFDERAKIDPENDENKLNSTYLYSALSSTYARLGNFDKATENYQKAMQIFDALVAHDANNLDYRQRRLITAFAYADELVRLRKIDAARRIYTDEFAAFEPAMKEKDAQFTLSTRGLLLEKLGDCDFALAGQTDALPAVRDEFCKKALKEYEDSLAIWSETAAQISPGVSDPGRIRIVRFKADSCRKSG